MEKNVGAIDRPLRIAMGLSVLCLFFFLGENLRWWALAGLVPLLTGLAGFCPLYRPFGVSTCTLR
ncbi:MAG: DUF2892 domain-containing protein [Pseudomonadota bacterium]